MAETTYKKRRDGLVINTDNAGLEHYQQAKGSVKALLKTKTDTRNEISSLKAEIEEMKMLMQQLLDKKN